jgi:preprotein translocase subunit SecG
VAPAVTRRAIVWLAVAWVILVVALAIAMRDAEIPPLPW